ncbi:hypothetical protein [Nitrososphaeria virus YSH_174770]|uniref:Uncharacterized protein n=1 Tax=Nitrososphaeria virus YSH_174770 TaxID=3071322 RepID=A0A976UBE6_9CAUD|nr:hypothetical protein QKV93_gp15 [Yangshan Harbor Nitrososphaeria virus]UVF62360.1 hypothetical protein [Nitrososphaeria virus YSH_174770]
MFGKEKKDKKISSRKESKIDFSDIRTRLGLTEHAPADKIAFELNKLKDKRKWSIYGLSEKDFKQFGVNL